MNWHYDASLRRGQAEHKDKWDPSDLDGCPQFHPYFGTGQRIKVQSPGGYTRTGRVSRTAGWKPALLLMHRSNDSGSSDLLTPKDRVIAIQVGREYRPVA